MRAAPSRIWIGVTDNDWFRFLRDQPGIDEVNFWQPSGSREFRALRPGDLFLFKAHSPLDYIVGGGFFVHFVRFPYQFVWDAFGVKNGTASPGEMRRRIEKYRRRPVDPNDQIGCIILNQPFFWEREDWIPSPKDFAKNIVQGKTYETDSAIGRELWAQVEMRLQMNRPLLVAEMGEPLPAISEPVLARSPLGLGAFRALVTESYQRRCAVTGEKALPTLDAAPIRPVENGGEYRLDNGLLLRSDVHRLFDAGYVTVTPEGRFLVSRRIQDDFGNGEPYRQFHDQKIWMPADLADRPDRRILEWHADTVFLR